MALGGVEPTTLRNLRVTTDSITGLRCTIRIDTISMDLSIFVFKGSQVKISKF